MANPKRPNQGILSLHTPGFNPDAPPAESIVRLGELLASGEASGVAIARALGNVRDARAAEMLIEMERGASGELRREVRRSLFRLRQHGVAAAEAAQPPSEHATAMPPAESGLSALISPTDAEGLQIVWLMKSRPGGGLVRIWGVVSEHDGLVNAGISALTRRELRAERAELERRSGVKLVEADPRLADFILCDAYRRTPKSRVGAAGNFYAMRAEMTGTPAPTQFAHPVYSELSAEAAGEPSIDLLKEPEIETYRIPDPELRPYLEQLNRAGSSLIVVSAAAQQERMLGVLKEAVEQLLSGDRLERLRRRLEHSAYYMMKTGRRRAAGWAAAAAARIRDGADLSRVVFFRALVERQIAATMAEQEEHRREEPRLIVTPAEAMRAQQERRMRTRGRRG